MGHNVRVQSCSICEFRRITIGVIPDDLERVRRFGLILWVNHLCSPRNPAAGNSIRATSLCGVHFIVVTGGLSWIGGYVRAGYLTVRFKISAGLLVFASD